VTTLFDLEIATLRLLGGARTGLATAGSTTTLTDTARRREAADYWNGGTVWILATTDGNAPEGERSLVTDFGSGILTFNAVTEAVGAGDSYVVSPPHWAYDILRDCVNLAIAQYRVPRMDTSLAVVAGQTEYDLPAGVQQGRVKEVYIQANDDSNDNRWRKVGEWWTWDTGSGQKLAVPAGLTTGMDLRIDYDLVHTDFDAGSDVLYEILEPKHIIYRAAEFMLLQQMYDGDEWPYLAERMNYFIAKADAYEAEYHQGISLHRRE
jgi:hypothetical protein